MDAADITPFRIETPEAVLSDLRERLGRTRFPDQLNDAGWDYGADLHYVKELCDYWRDRFDWRAAEARFNAFPQFVTEIDGERLHFYHARSPEADALPLIITHGWPGSVAEFLDVLGPLSDPAAHGGDARDAFHVIAPSIPGYGFSGPTKKPGFNAKRAAEVNTVLMERLGYPRYGAQGGDWGSAISSQMAAAHPERLVGLHLNFIGGRPADPGNPHAGLSAEEIEYLATKADYNAHETGYQAIQSTKPQSLAYGLTDSPAGLAAWIVEKFHAWSDCGGDVETVYSKDRLLENIMLYWVTGTINASMRMYYESMGPGRRAPGYGGRIETPTGHARYPAEVRRTPRSWAEQMYNIVHWTKMPKGGHFAAMEQPELFVEDVRSFFRPLRQPAK
ncbi:epoxide hydrolase family protein [Phenylobacterium sp.]|jgi:microsomal epoxide hydrolase|uniref:epoxide hydrolase family protein n=1 Tax=Phenylobacterium sp. TaxID=1871053 RepID=UPI002F3EBA63